MLVLTRKRSEMIQIGEDIFVKVIRTGKSTVKIGIQAPPHVRILRAELCEESLLAANGDTIDLDEPEERDESSPGETPAYRLDPVPHSHLF